MAVRKRTTKKVTKKTKKKAKQKKTITTDGLDSDGVDTAATMLARRCTPDAIRKVISLMMYGGRDTKPTVPKRLISQLDLGKYLNAAKQLALDSYRRNKDDQKALAMATYEMVIRDVESEPKDVLKAQQRIDALMGHDYAASGDARSDEERALDIIIAIRAAKATVPSR